MSHLACTATWRRLRAQVSHPARRTASLRRWVARFGGFAGGDFPAGRAFPHGGSQAAHTLRIAALIYSAKKESIGRRRSRGDRAIAWWSPAARCSTLQLRGSSMSAATPGVCACRVRRRPPRVPANLGYGLSARTRRESQEPSGKRPPPATPCPNPGGCLAIETRLSAS